MKTVRRRRQAIIEEGPFLKAPIIFASSLRLQIKDLL
jgi:hypothetical protein